MEAIPDQVYVPATIKVHLGKPGDNAEDVEVPFLTYIKNVASSEVYPTWPENAIRANMYAQTSFALNRIFTEFYRARGYDFDITSLPDYDQAYVHNRSIFGPMEKAGNELFNDYIRRKGFMEPMFARYCDGRTSSCPGGLSQWGTVDLAKQGKTPLEILQNYYGKDIEVVENAPIIDLSESYPGYPLKKGATDGFVARIQNQLNRVGKSYPSIPKVEANGLFDQKTEDAVKAFQKAFNLAVDGIVGKGTWYKLQYVYIAVKKLAELHSEGEQMRAAPMDFARTMKLGDSGKDIHTMKYMINTVANFNPAIPNVVLNGNYNEETRNAVLQFQKYAGLPETGVADLKTYDRLHDEYMGAELSHAALFRQAAPRPYPGYVLNQGAVGPDVTALQLYLLAISKIYPVIPTVVAPGYYGSKTVDSVKAFQKLFGLPPDGVVGPQTWNKIIEVYSQIKPTVIT